MEQGRCDAPPISSRDSASSRRNDLPLAMPNKTRPLSEAAEKHSARLDALIRRRFNARNMSDAKWVKLLRAAAALSETVPRMDFKLVYGPEVHSIHTPTHAEGVEPRWFKEPLIYKEVEWVEFPLAFEIPRGSGLAPLTTQQDIASLKRHLNSVANFPLLETTTGLRVLAYAEI